MGCHTVEAPGNMAPSVIVTHSIRVLSEIFHPKGTPWRAGQVYKPTFELTHNNLQ